MAFRFLLVAVLAAVAAHAETGFLKRTVNVAGTTYRYVVYVPGEWTAQKKWPVILFLHGSIERGDDGVSQSSVGLGHVVRKHPERFPAIIVMPQCRTNAAWETESMQAQALAALDASSREFNGDAERTYLTGFSMGGYGTWNIAAKYPNRFAALVVVCGGIVWPPSATEPGAGTESPYARTARKVAGIPVWVIHGDADQNVLVTESRRMVAALKALKADVRYTEYKGVAHFMWDRAYDEPGLPAWLFSQRLKAAAPGQDADHEFDDGSRIVLKELTDIQTANLATLGKVWGFLKYHHPQVAAGKRNFDYDLFRILPAILAATNGSTAQTALVRWITTLGEVTTCTECATLLESDLHLRPDVAWISDETALGAELSRTLKRILHNRPTGRQFYVSLAPGVGNPVFDHEQEYKAIQFPDAGYQLLALYRFWNIVEYWYPYRDVIGGKWDAVLTEFVPRIGLAKDRDSYQREMRALMARVNDTHVNLWGSLAGQPPGGVCQLAVNVRFLERYAVVASYAGVKVGEATGLKPGDVIQKVDGVDVEDLVRRWGPFYPASNEPTRLRDIGRSLTRGDCAKPAALRVRRGDETIDVTAARVPVSALDFRTLTTHDQPGETFRLLSKDIAYLKLSSIKVADVARYIESAAGTKGLIIDIRNYPSEFVVFSLGRLLVNKPTEFARFTNGDLANPGAFHWGATTALRPQQPHYAGKTVILVDETSLSQAEYTAMAFRSVADAWVIGSTTAGADGNVSPILLPGGLNTMISGIGVFYPDKKPTQRAGIVPDQTVTPTIEGFRDGRDEVLEAAIRRIAGQGIPDAVVQKMAAPAPDQGRAGKFADTESGISMQLPAGWDAQPPFRWGDQQTTVRLTGAPGGGVATLYFQVLRDPSKLTEAETETYLEEAVKAKQEQRRSAGRAGYTIRAGSCVARRVSGHVARSCIGDFDEGGRSMSEYLTFVRTDSLVILFFGETQAVDFEAFRRSFDSVIQTIVIP